MKRLILIAVLAGVAVADNAEQVVPLTRTESMALSDVTTRAKELEELDRKAATLRKSLNDDVATLFSDAKSRLGAKDLRLSPDGKNWIWR